MFYLFTIIDTLRTICNIILCLDILYMFFLLVFLTVIYIIYYAKGDYFEGTTKLWWKFFYPYGVIFLVIGLLGTLFIPSADQLCLMSNMNRYILCP